MGILSYGFFVCKRMWKKLYYRPIHLVVSFIQPVFWLTIFGYLFQHKFSFEEGSYLGFLLPGVCAMTILQSSAQSGILFIKDFQSQFFGRYNYVPVSKFQILFFKILADFSRVFVQVILLVLIGRILGIAEIQISVGGILLAFLASFLFTFFYASLSCIIALRTKVSELMATFVHLFNLPIIFTSTALVPNKDLPSWLKVIAQYNPLSHLSELLRESFIQVSYPSSVSGNGLLILACLATISFVFCGLFLKTIRYE